MSKFRTGGRRPSSVIGWSGFGRGGAAYGWSGPGGVGGLATPEPKKTKTKKRRTPAQVAATEALVARNKARAGKTSRKSPARKTATKRKKAVGFALGAARVRRPGHRAVTIVAPHASGGHPCPNCGRYHGLRQHWSHKKGPRSTFTRTEHDYLCRRYGVCAAKRPKKTAGKRKKGKKRTVRRQGVQKVSPQVRAVLAKWNKKARGKKR